jgi:hypothetical protein
VRQANQPQNRELSKGEPNDGYQQSYVCEPLLAESSMSGVKGHQVECTESRQHGARQATPRRRQGEKSSHSKSTCAWKRRERRARQSKSTCTEAPRAQSSPVQSTCAWKRRERRARQSKSTCAEAPRAQSSPVQSTCAWKRRERRARQCKSTCAEAPRAQSSPVQSTCAWKRRAEFTRPGRVVQDLDSKLSASMSAASTTEKSKSKLGYIYVSQHVLSWSTHLSGHDRVSVSSSLSSVLSFQYVVSRSEFLLTSASCRRQLRCQHVLSMPISQGRTAN